MTFPRRVDPVKCVFQDGNRGAAATPASTFEDGWKTARFAALAAEHAEMDAHIAAVVQPDRLQRVYALQRSVVAGASAVGGFAVAAGRRSCCA